jgi:hypothetical protein
LTSSCAPLLLLAGPVFGGGKDQRVPAKATWASTTDGEMTYVTVCSDDL